MRTRSQHVRSMVMATLAVLSLTRPSAAQLPALPQLGIDNFGRVNDAYYRGAQPVGSD